MAFQNYFHSLTKYLCNNHENLVSTKATELSIKALWTFHTESNNLKWSSNLYQVKFLQISAVLCLNMISCKFCNRSKWGMKRSLTLILFLWSTLLVLDICLAENLAIELSTWHQLKVARQGKRRGKDNFWVTLSGFRTDWSKRKIVMRLGTGWPNAVQSWQKS